jgi:pyruvate-formate lyase
MWKILGKDSGALTRPTHIVRFSQTVKPISTTLLLASAIIVCEAAINHSRRYAALAREMAETETRSDRKAELLQIASICEHVPEYPARTFQEALQSMAIVGVCKNYEHPMHNNPQWGRGDQYLHPYLSRILPTALSPWKKPPDCSQNS